MLAIRWCARSTSSGRGGLRSDAEQAPLRALRSLPLSWALVVVLCDLEEGGGGGDGRGEEGGEVVRGVGGVWCNVEGVMWRVVGGG